MRGTAPRILRRKQGTALSLVSLMELGNTILKNAFSAGAGPPILPAKFSCKFQGVFLRTLSMKAFRVFLRQTFRDFQGLSGSRKRFPGRLQGFVCRQHIFFQPRGFSLACGDFPFRGHPPLLRVLRPAFFPKLLRKPESGLSNPYFSQACPRIKACTFPALPWTFAVLQG